MAGPAARADRCRARTRCSTTCAPCSRTWRAGTPRRRSCSATASAAPSPRGLILSSPALRVSAGPAERALLAVARRVANDRAFPNRLPVGKLSHDPREVAAYKADGLNHDRITPRLYDFLVDAGATARRDAPRFTVPTLLLVAGADALVDARGSRELSAALPAGVGTLHWYDGLYHELFNEREPDRTLVLDDLAAWLDEQLGGT